MSLKSYNISYSSSNYYLIFMSSTVTSVIQTVTARDNYINLKNASYIISLLTRKIIQTTQGRQ
jgi:hypothetical protein